MDKKALKDSFITSMFYVSVFSFLCSIGLSIVFLSINFSAFFLLLLMIFPIGAIWHVEYTYQAHLNAKGNKK